MTKVTVEDASGAIDEFLELPVRLFGRDPLWIPPLRDVVRREVLNESAFARYGRVRPLLARRGSTVVGRAAAFTSDRLRDASGAVFGQVGFFECDDDEDAARALVGACAERAAAEGARQLLGPMNGGAHRAHRLMVRGFERTPHLFEPRNPPYYVHLFEACGFRPVHAWHAFDIARARFDELRSVFRAAVTRASRRWSISLVGRHDVTGTLARLHAILDAVWAGHVGYSSLDPDELAEVFLGLLVLMSDRHIGIAVDKDGTDQGAAFMFPDYADEVRALQGDASRWGAFVGGPLPKRLVLHTVALTPRARGTGAAAVLIDRGLANAIEDGHDEIVIALVSQEFSTFLKFLEPTREYALFGRAI